MAKTLIASVSVLSLFIVLLFSCSDSPVTNPTDSGIDGDADSTCPGGCPENLVCRSGECVDPEVLCQDVNCPEGQTCNMGICVDGDPCDDVICTNPGELCRNGECVAGEADEDEDGFKAIVDCDDHNPNINPEATEECNGVDDDCDDAIDETFDNDGDGFPGCELTPEEFRDCNDESAWIYPGAEESCNGVDDNCDGEEDEGDPGGGGECGESTGACEMGVEHCVGGTLVCVGAIIPRDEVCNGADDDCNGVPDDGTADASCDPLDNATVGCVDDECHITACDDLYANLDDDESNGCETPLDNYAETCETALDVGDISDIGTEVTVTGTIAPIGDIDWINFRAVDEGEPASGCDQFHLQIEFTENPEGQYAFEVRRGSCTDTTECSSVTEPITEYEYSVTGECPCASPQTSTGINLCQDQSAEYYIRVYRIEGGYSPEQYVLNIRNGSI